MGERRRLPVHKKELVIADGEYKDWTFTAVTNPPLGVIENLAARELKQVVEGLAKIIVLWDFVDEEGELMGVPSQENIRKLPVDLIAAISETYVKNISTLPQA